MKTNIFLTFDCEDCINSLSTTALKRVLEILKKYDLKGIFFITGHYCELLKDEKDILRMLKTHEIGYHSSSHCVHPTLYEFTDIENYNDALQISLKRETSKINTLTGKIEDNGGIVLLKELFPENNITAFRAPNFSWSPPHLEALVKLGIKFDFSTNLAQVPIYFKKITFYPFPILDFGILKSHVIPFTNISPTSLVRLFKKIVLFHPLVFFIHPHDFTNAEYWDKIYFDGNPKKIQEVSPRSYAETQNFLTNFDLFLRKLYFLKDKDLIDVTPSLKKGTIVNNFSKSQIIKSYQRSILGPKTFFNYTPSFMLKHFYTFFNYHR